MIRFETVKKIYRYDDGDNEHDLPAKKTTDIIDGSTATGGQVFKGVLYGMKLIVSLELQNDIQNDKPFHP